MKNGDRSIEGSYERGDITLARFGDACPGCLHARPSGSSYLCAAKEMRVFADTTCVQFVPRDTGIPGAPLAVRLKLYRANLAIEIAIAEHLDAQARVRAANGGRVG